MEVTGIITAIIVGLIIGALGRLVVPGKQNMDRTDYPGRAGRRRVALVAGIRGRRTY